MSSQSLFVRLQALSETYKQTLDLINRLQKLPTNPGTFPSNGDPRVELASEIHQNLTEQEDALEILRQEADDFLAPNGVGGGRWVGGGSITRRRDSEREQERDRNAATIARLGEDLKAARASFRRAQLQAKRNADTARRKEREMLFANRSTDAETLPPARRKGQEKLTQDELALNASSDVTAALRRTHDLLQGNLEHSQFAQQTLDESSSALASLSESYSGLGDLLKNSRGLVGQLLRSQKSDTWYLETAFYMLVATICWLFFRRIIYGPFWWLVWQPLKLTWWMIMTTLTGVGIVGGQKGTAVSSPAPQSVSSPGLNSRGIPTLQPRASPPYMMVGAKGGGWDRPLEPPPLQNEKTLAEEIGDMAQRSHDETISGGPSVTEISDEPRNTKKRMMEAEPTLARDEL